MTDKKDYWSDCGQIFFHYGLGYGVTVSLQAICLGSEVDIKKFFDTGDSQNLNPDKLSVLEQIKEQLKERDNARIPEVKRPGLVRSRPARDVKRRTENLRQPKTRKELPIH